MKDEAAYEAINFLSQLDNELQGVEYIVDTNKTCRRKDN